MSDAEREMPRFMSNKVVHALKLKAIGSDGVLVPLDEAYSPVNVGADWVANRIHDRVGGDDPGYYVVYPDGYTSWSPTKPFESGYVGLVD